MEYSANFTYILHHAACRMPPKTKTYKPKEPTWSNSVGNFSYNQRPNNAWQAPSVVHPKPKFNSRGSYR